MKLTKDIIKEKMELICEAVDDYRKGELNDMAAIVAIGVLVQAKEPDPKAVEWAKKQFMKGCDCGSFEGDCHNC